MFEETIMTRFLVAIAVAAIVVASAAAYINSGLTREQYKQYETLLRTNPKAAEAYYKQILDEGKRLETAKANAREENRRKQMAEFRQELQAFDEAYQNKPKDAQFHYKRGRLIDRAATVHGDSFLPLPDYSKTIEIDPKCALAYLRRGQILMMRGRENENREKGFHDIMTAVKLDPENESIQAYAAFAHLDRKIKLGDPAAALEHAKKAATIGNNKNPDTLQVLAHVYCSRGEFETALKLQTEANRLMNKAKRPLNIENVRLEQYTHKMPSHYNNHFDMEAFDRLLDYRD